MQTSEKIILLIITFFILSISVNAQVDSWSVSWDSNGDKPGGIEVKDYAVISREYDLFVMGSDLTDVSLPPQLVLIGINDDKDMAQYKFKPGNIAGERNFGEFKVNVLSEAEELANSIGSVNIDVNDKNSTIKINNLNLSNKIIRIVNLSDVQDLENARYNLDVDQLLKGLTFDLNFVKDQTHPIYNSLNIDASSTAGTVILAIVSFNNINCDGILCSVGYINAHPDDTLNQVIDKYNANVTYGFNAKSIKEGNNFLFWSDEGYSNLEHPDLENLQNLINDRVKLISPDEVVNFLIPLSNFSKFKKFVEFNITVDFNNLKLEDGTYTLYLNYEDKYHNKGKKPFTVKLDVTNTIAPQVPINGTVEFKDAVINQTLEKLENLPDDVNLTVVIFGNVRPTEFPIPTAEVKTALKFMQLNLSQENVTGSFDLSFKIDKTLISSSDKTNVLLYVEENDTWRSLTTTFIGETATEYKYKATIPHFSNFMIGVQSVATSSTGNSGTGNGGDSSDDEDVVILPTPLPVPLPKPATISPIVTIPLAPAPTAEAPKGFLAITAAAITDLVKQNPLAAVFFGLLAILLTLVVYTLLFRKQGKPNKGAEKDRGEGIVRK